MIWTTVMCCTHEGVISRGCQKQKIFYNLCILQFIDFVAILICILCKSLLGKTHFIAKVQTRF